MVAVKRFFPLLALLLLLGGCGGGQESTPEARVRALIAQGEQAAEARSLDFFKETIAPGYSDLQDRTRKDLLRMLTGYFLRNHSIHLWLRVADVRLQGEARAQVTLYAGMAGSPADGLEQLLAMHADVYRFELLFDLTDGDRLIRADWRRARGDEAVSGQ